MLLLHQRLKHLLGGEDVWEGAERLVAPWGLLGLVAQGRWAQWQGVADPQLWSACGWNLRRLKAILVEADCVHRAQSWARWNLVERGASWVAASQPWPAGRRLGGQALPDHQRQLLLFWFFAARSLPWLLVRLFRDKLWLLAIALQFSQSLWHVTGRGLDRSSSSSKCSRRGRVFCFLLWFVFVVRVLLQMQLAQLLGPERYWL